MQDDAALGGQLADGGGGGRGGLQDVGGHGPGGQVAGGHELGELGGLRGGHAHPVGGGRGDDVVDWAGRQDPAAADDQEVVGGLGHLAHEVGGDEHGAALAGQTAAGLTHPLDALGVQAVDGLVEQEHTGVAQQGRRDAQALAHAQGEALDALLGHRGQAGDVQDLVDPLGGDAVGGGQLAQVAAGAARAVQALGVQQGTDLAQGGRQLPVGAPVDRDLAAGGLVQAHNHAHRGGLARPVGAQEAGDGAGLDGEGDVVHRRLLAITLGEIDCLDHDVLSSTWASGQGWVGGSPWFFQGAAPTEQPDGSSLGVRRRR